MERGTSDHASGNGKKTATGKPPDASIQNGGEVGLILMQKQHCYVAVDSKLLLACPKY